MARPSTDNGTEQLESEVCPEEHRRIWAPTKQQLESDVSYARKGRIWKPSPEQLESNVVEGRRRGQSPNCSEIGFL